MTAIFSKFRMITNKHLLQTNRRNSFFSHESLSRLSSRDQVTHSVSNLELRVRIFDSCSGKNATHTSAWFRGTDLYHRKWHPYPLVSYWQSNRLSINKRDIVNAFRTYHNEIRIRFWNRYLTSTRMKWRQSLSIWINSPFRRRACSALSRVSIPKRGFFLNSEDRRWDRLARCPDLYLPQSPSCTLDSLSAVS